ncbi:MAG: hypothetical protein LBV44_01340 [Methylobacillus sp.]|jgi:hypothetical protein|nr:hypothetical protein [Methylobacillus sp.]
MKNWEKELISENDFFNIWGAYVKNNGDMFFFEDVKFQPPNYVWTIIECDSDYGRSAHWIASPGFHIVNILGYVMTQKPWNNDTPDAFYSYDDFNLRR